MGFHKHSRWMASIAVAASVAALAGGCSSSKPKASTASTTPPTSTTGSAASVANGGATAPGVTGSTVSIGIEYDGTGIASSTFADTAAAIEARFMKQNAAGGVNGRKITWSAADDQSTPAGAATAANDLVQDKNVFAVSEVSALFFAAAPQLQQAGIPVVGSSLDGPEWNQQPNTNMFAVTGTSTPTPPSYTSGGFWKSLNVSKISFISSNTPSSTAANNAAIAGVKAEGLDTCNDFTVPLGSVAFTTYALSFKKDGCQAALCSCVLSSSLAVATALRQQGLNVPVEFGAGPSNDVLQSPVSEAAATGAVFPGTLFNDPAGQAMLNGLKQYDPQYKGGLPDLGSSIGWEVANLVIEGLQVAGPNLTRQSFITNLRNVTNWTDEGLATEVGQPINFSTFGQAPPAACATYVKFDGKSFQNYLGGKKFCGTEVTSSSSSSPATS